MIEKVRQGMRKVVNEGGGTAGKARIKGVRSPARPAQRSSGASGVKDNHTWFIAFAPYEAPKYAVCVMVQGAKSGGGVSAPIAAKILEETFALDKGKRVPLACARPCRGQFQLCRERGLRSGNPNVHDDRGRRRDERQQRPLASTGLRRANPPLPTCARRRTRAAGSANRVARARRPSGLEKFFNFLRGGNSDKPAEPKGSLNPFQSSPMNACFFQQFSSLRGGQPAFFHDRNCKKILGLGNEGPGTNSSSTARNSKSASRCSKTSRSRNTPSSARPTATSSAASTKGGFDNIEHGLKAMFVDIGFEKNAFLHFWDALPAALDSGVEEVARAGRKKEGAKDHREGHPEASIPVGSEVLVQVTKGPIGTKGPRITTNISLAGRYLVLMPYSDQSGISRKIEDPKERERLRKILRELDIPEGMGVIMRTVGEGQRARYFVRDLDHSSRAMATTSRRAMKRTPGAGLRLPGARPDRAHRARLPHRRNRRGHLRRPRACERMQRSRRPDLQALRSASSTTPAPADLRALRRAEANRRRLSPPGLAAVRRLHRHRRNRGAHRHRREHRPQQRRARTSRKPSSRPTSKPPTKCRRQLRLRNIGGLIIGDFIDMKSRKDQQTVYQRMKDRLRRDKAKTHVLPISPLGLMEMTRQRAAESRSAARSTSPARIATAAARSRAP